MPSVTSPAPARKAEMEVMAAAPVFPGDPAITSKWPVVPLWASGTRGLKQDWIISLVKSHRPGPTSLTIWDGIPISTILSDPTYAAPGRTMWPVLAKAKVAVALARIHTPHAWPVSEFSPEGMSTAITGLLRPLIKSMMVLKYPLTSDFKPVPRMASTHTSNPAISDWCLLKEALSGIATTGTSSGCRSLRLAAASPWTLFASDSRYTYT